MIYTITFNPAIDRILKFDKEFKLNYTNRAIYDKKYAAGKGIHIAKLLSNLGEECKALYLSGKNDEWFHKNLKEQNINGVKFLVGGNIRTNLKLISENQQTESNGLGMTGPFENAISNMSNYLKKNLSHNDFVIIAGSFPKNFTKKLLNKILETISSKTKNIVIDTSSQKFLPLLLKYKPIFIKPNENEIETFNDLGYSLDKMLSLGVESIIISQGEKGAKLVTNNFSKSFPLDKKFEIKNLAGSGDSMIAGIIYKLKYGFSIEDSIRFGLICGTATATSDKIASLKRIKEIDEELKWNLF